MCILTCSPVGFCAQQFEEHGRDAVRSGGFGAGLPGFKSELDDFRL